jgi:hypothetical protein
MERIMLDRRNTHRLGIVALLVVALMAVGLGPAAAAPPLKLDDRINEQGVACVDEGFAYDLDLYGSLMIREKRDGTISLFENWHGTIEGNGKTLRVHHAFTMTIADGTVKITGLPFGIWDGGNSLFDRGLVVIGPEVFKVAGPHPVGPPPGNHLATCALLDDG